MKNHKETHACALVSLLDFSPPSVYKFHILSKTINKLHISPNTIMSYCSLFTKNDNIYDVQSLNRVILLGTLPNLVKMFSTKMSFSSSEMVYIEIFFQELLPFVKFVNSAL